MSRFSTILEWCKTAVHPQNLSKDNKNMDNSLDMEPEEYLIEGYEDFIKDKPFPEENYLQPKEFVKSLVRDHRVVVFSKTHCPYCDDSKSLLLDMGVDFKTVELDQIDRGSDIQSTLGEITNAKTVPRIFIDGECVGGNSDLQLLNSKGELLSRLKMKNLPMPVPQ